MVGGLRFKSKSHNTEMRLAVPVGSFSKIGIESDKGIAIPSGPPKECLVVTLAQALPRGVGNRMPILPQGFRYFNSDILVEKEPMYQS